jgi:1-acyl-sn-glycerol-3-phosphate acyltransferase
MNIQPYGKPTRHWSPRMTPWWYRMLGPLRRRALRREKMAKIGVEGLEHLDAAMKAGHGILLTPNHSFHWDSYCLMEAARSLSTPFYFMSAWQVFAMSKWFERESMQRCGCFSVDREGTDMQALKTAIDVLQNRPHPLVIFPEGDVYHTNDRVMPFRDGAAAIASMAAKKTERPIRIIPVAIKRWYIEDPEPSLRRTVEALEKRLTWRPTPELSIPARILRVGEGLLALKEWEYRQQVFQGTLIERKEALMNSMLSELESRYDIRPKDCLVSERVKEIRRRVIERREKAPASDEPAKSNEQLQWAKDMDTVFLIVQLYSYPGDYLVECPSTERVVETLDKLEEDVLGATYPTIHGEREVLVRFGSPIEVPGGKEKRGPAAELTDTIEKTMQRMLNQMNEQRPTRAFLSFEKD